MKNGEGFVLVYSVISSSTFKEIRTFRDDILRVKNVKKVVFPQF